MRRAYRWLIVGAGFTGATLAERIARELDQRVLVIDRRDHIGGNAYEELDDAGVLIHRYGPHIFHTNAPSVWNYLSGFTEWRPYVHRVRAMIDGQAVPIPFGFRAIDALFPERQAEQFKDRLLAAFGAEARVPVLKLRDHADPELRALGQFAYERVFDNYTVKQWGMPPEALDPSVMARVPVVVGRDDRYFTDQFQAQPRHGFTPLFRRLLAHPNIHVMLNAGFRDVEDLLSFDRVIFTGPIDEFFDYRHGPLPYRSLRFEYETVPRAPVQEVAVLNFPNEQDYTRVTEMVHLTGQTTAASTLVREYPMAHMPGISEPYYPIPTAANRALYARYQRDADQLGTVLFAGRLGDYSYYNMDQAVARGLSLFDKIVVPRAA